MTATQNIELTYTGVIRTAEYGGGSKEILGFRDAKGNTFTVGMAAGSSEKFTIGKQYAINARPVKYSSKDGADKTSLKQATFRD